MKYLHGPKRKLMHKTAARTTPAVRPSGPLFGADVWGTVLHFSLQSITKHQISHPHPTGVLFLFDKRLSPNSSHSSNKSWLELWRSIKHMKYDSQLLLHELLAGLAALHLLLSCSLKVLSSFLQTCTRLQLNGLLGHVMLQ